MARTVAVGRNLSVLRSVRAPCGLASAATIMRVGADKGLDGWGQALGVMTAMGESILLVLDRRDADGPDSRGLFQQRANDTWGTYADRMDPARSAAMFFDALLAVEDWRELEPTIAANRVQRRFDVDQIGGQREVTVDQGGHPAGSTLDFMTGHDRAGGEQIVSYLLEHAGRLSVDYVIWR